MKNLFGSIAIVASFLMVQAQAEIFDQSKRLEIHEYQQSADQIQRWLSVTTKGEIYYTVRTNDQSSSMLMLGRFSQAVMNDLNQKIDRLPKRELIRSGGTEQCSHGVNHAFVARRASGEEVAFAKDQDCLRYIQPRSAEAVYLRDLLSALLNIARE